MSSAPGTVVPDQTDANSRLAGWKACDMRRAGGAQNQPAPSAIRMASTRLRPPVLVMTRER
jgi:hypothetical protein